MTVDKTLLIKNVQKRETMLVAYCGFTGMPLVVCDPETFNDQVWIFETEPLLQEFAKKIYRTQNSSERRSVQERTVPAVLLIPVYHGSK